MLLRIRKNKFLCGALFALLIGFYDGFIGPGADSVLILFSGSSTLTTFPYRPHKKDVKKI